MLVLRSGEKADGGRTWWSNSDNSGFLLQMQGDGNLCIYYAGGHVVWAAATDTRGTRLTLDNQGLLQLIGPSGAVLWSSVRKSSNGSYMALLGRDGNLGVYEGTDPDNPGAPVWGTSWLGGLTTTVQAVNHFVYNLDAVQTASLNDYELASVKVDNTKGTEPLTVTKSLSGSTSNSSSWTFGGGLKVTVQTQITSGIPFLAEGKVSVGIEASFNFSHTGTVTTQTTDSLSATVTAKPGECLVLALVVQQCNATIPYTCDATVQIKEWNNAVVTIPGFSGTFSGGISSQGQVTERAEVDGKAVSASEVVPAVRLLQ